MADDSLQPPWRLGVVSFLNARPLIEGFEADPRFELRCDVPSRLPRLLASGEVDAALIPVIDLAAGGHDWRIISDACIGCDGETLTVRVFSCVPPEAVTRLHVDGDSHTSIALASILWKERYHRRLEIVPWTGGKTPDPCQALLLIGDKVVTNAPADLEIETDLGALWKSLTSLPFVFAVWVAPPTHDASELAGHLASARDRGIAAAGMIAEDYAPAMGWPVSLAKRYLTRRLRFRLGERERKGMTRFLELAKADGRIPADQELSFA